MRGPRRQDDSRGRRPRPSEVKVANEGGKERSAPMFKLFEGFGRRAIFDEES
jgi:hypothetical protein